MSRFLVVFGILFFLSINSFAHDKPWLDPDLKYPVLDHILEAVGHTQCVEEPKSLAIKQLMIAQERYEVLHLWREEYQERFPEELQDLAFERLSLGMQFLRELCGDEVADTID